MPLWHEEPKKKSFTLFRGGFQKGMFGNVWGKGLPLGIQGSERRAKNQPRWAAACRQWSSLSDIGWSMGQWRGRMRTPPVLKSVWKVGRGGRKFICNAFDFRRMNQDNERKKNRSSFCAMLIPVCTPNWVNKGDWGYPVPFVGGLLFPMKPWNPYQPRHHEVEGAGSQRPGLGPDNLLHLRAGAVVEAPGHPARALPGGTTPPSRVPWEGGPGTLPGEGPTHLPPPPPTVLEFQKKIRRGGDAGWIRWDWPPVQLRSHELKEFGGRWSGEACKRVGAGAHPLDCFDFSGGGCLRPQRRPWTRSASSSSRLKTWHKASRGSSRRKFQGASVYGGAKIFQQEKIALLTS